MKVITCTFCLSLDRNLFVIEERSFRLLLHSVFEGSVGGLYMQWLQMEERLQACWHCQRRINNFASFTQSAQQSVQMLKEYLDGASDQTPPQHQSSLGLTDVEIVDIPPLVLHQLLKTEPEPQGSAFHYEFIQLPKEDLKLEDNSFQDMLSEASDEEYRQEAKERENEVEKQENAEEVTTVKGEAEKKKKQANSARNRSVRRPNPSESKELGWSVRWASAASATAWYETERAAETPALYRCDLCRRAFHSADQLALHQADCHKESAGKYECDICRYRFVYKNEMCQHIEQHFLEFVCRRCPFRARTVQSMEVHCSRGCYYQPRVKKPAEKRPPKPKRTYHCKRCKGEFATFALLTEHRLECNTFNCDKCEKSFSRAGAYYDHKTIHKEGGHEKFYCHTCKKQFTSACWFRKHFSISIKHVSRDTFKYQCPNCSMKFPNQHKLKGHINNRHLNLARFACNLCHKRYLVNNSLRKHKARVHNVGDVVCELCGMALPSASFLPNHMRQHTGEKPFKCLLCPAVFGLWANMYKHTMAKHNKRLKKDGLLYDSPTYECEECGKKFPSYDKKYTHTRVVHRKPSTLSCTACNKVLTSSGNLKDHMASRHGVLCSVTFNCDTCGKRYNTKWALKAHMKGHRETPPPLQANTAKLV